MFLHIEKKIIVSELISEIKVSGLAFFLSRIDPNIVSSYNDPELKTLQIQKEAEFHTKMSQLENRIEKIGQDASMKLNQIVFLSLSVLTFFLYNYNYNFVVFPYLYIPVFEFFQSLFLYFPFIISLPLTFFSFPFIYHFFNFLFLQIHSGTS